MNAGRRRRPRIQQRRDARERGVRIGGDRAPAPGQRPPSSASSTTAVACVSASSARLRGLARKRDRARVRCRQRRDAVDAHLGIATKLAAEADCELPEREGHGRRAAARALGAAAQRAGAAGFGAAGAGAGAPAAGFGARDCSDAQDRRRDVERRHRVDDAVRDHEIEVLRLRIRAHFLDERALQARHLFVAAGVEVVLHLAAASAAGRARRRAGLSPRGCAGPADMVAPSFSSLSSFAFSDCSCCCSSRCFGVNSVRIASSADLGLRATLRRGGRSRPRRSSLPRHAGVVDARRNQRDAPHLRIVQSLHGTLTS